MAQSYGGAQTGSADDTGGTGLSVARAGTGGAAVKGAAGTATTKTNIDLRDGTLATWNTSTLLSQIT